MSAHTNKHIDAAIEIVDSDMFKGLMTVDRIGKCAEMVAEAIAEAEALGLERAAEMRAALKRQVENIERWMETGIPADADESRSIYGQLRAALDKVEAH